MLNIKTEKYEQRFPLNIDQTYCDRAASAHHNDSNNTKVNEQMQQRVKPNRNTAAHTDTHTIQNEYLQYIVATKAVTMRSMAPHVMFRVNLLSFSSYCQFFSILYTSSGRYAHVHRPYIHKWMMKKR